jgi:hypothetical protein
MQEESPFKTSLKTIREQASWIHEFAGVVTLIGVTRELVLVSPDPSLSRYIHILHPFRCGAAIGRTKSPSHPHM